MTNMTTQRPRCIFCQEPITSFRPEGFNSMWVHLNGDAECRPKIAAPDFSNPVSVAYERIELAESIARGIYDDVWYEG